jgi:3-oxoacyl-[acyl-carrier protein] reductase
MRETLKGRRAFVSGSSSGIGAAIAHDLAAQGATVFVHGRDKTRADGVAEALRAKGATAHVALGALDSDAAVAAIGRQVDETTGGVDILVNVAGNAGTESWDNSSAEVFHAQYQTNTVSAVRLINTLLPAMRRQRHGRIVQISSIAAIRPLPDQVPGYASAKAALLALTASLAMTVAGDGVNVNTVSPGFVLTPALRHYFLSLPDNAGKTWDALEPAIAEMLGIRLGRLGRPEDIAGIVSFLVGPGGDWITGSNFRIDGGNLSILY